MSAGGEQVQWAWVLVDKMSAAADKMTKSLKGTEKATRDASSAGFDLEFMLERLAEKAYRAGRALASAAFEAGAFVVNTLAFKENTIASFELMLGDAKKARDLYAEAALFAKYTPFETKPVVESFQQLLSAGFSRQESRVLFQALGDVSAAGGDFAGHTIGRITTQLAQMKSLGHATMGDLRPILSETAKLGVGWDTFYEKAAKNMGKTKAEVMELEKTGKLAADVSIFSLVEAIQERVGGKVGNLMDRQSKTVSGLLSTVRSIPFDFVNKLDPDKSKGLQAFKGFLESIVNLFDVGNAAGNKMVGMIENVFDSTFETLFGQFAGPEGQKNLEDFMNTAIDYVGQFLTVARDLGRVIKDVVPSLSTIHSILEKMHYLFSGGLGEDIYGLTHGERSLSSGGGLKGSAGYVKTVDPADYLQLENGQVIPRPETLMSRPQLEVAEQMSRAFADQVDMAVGKGIAFKDIGEAVKAPPRLAGATITVPVTISLDASQSMDPAGIARALADLLPAQLELAFERLATEAGAS